MIIHNPIEILVIGGGIIGLSSALAMRHRGFTVCILDTGPSQTPHELYNKRVYALNPASQARLATLGVWDTIDAFKRTPYRKMHVWDAVNGAQLDFDTRLLGAPELGSILGEHVLKEALLQQCLAQGVTMHHHTYVRKLVCTDHNAQVHSDTATWLTDFVIIADGVNSPTRTQLQVPTTTWPYHQHALVATVASDKPHDETAYQIFTPDGPLAFLPLSHPHHTAIVWSMPPTQATHLLTCANDLFNQALSHTFMHKLGHSHLLSDRYTYPLHMHHTTRYYGPRWILIGDAAHSIHPLAGLGLNLGFADLNTWINCLDNNKNNFLSIKTLGSYQRERKHAVWQTILLMDAIKRIFSNPWTPITTLRGASISLLNKMPTIKRLMMEHASGVTL